MNTRLGVVLSTAIALGAGTAHADISIDFNDRGFSVISPTLAGWEGFVLGPAGQTNTNITDPVTRTFGEIEVTLSLIAGAGSDAFIHDVLSADSPANSGDFTLFDMMRDSVHVKDSVAGEGLSILIKGLTPNAQYDGRIWSYDVAHANTPANWGIFAADWYANGVQFADDVNLAGPLPTTNTDYSHAFSVVANAQGEVVLQGLRDAASGGNPVLINGLQLTLVPEPASVMLVGLGATCLLTRRTRS